MDLTKLSIIEAIDSPELIGDQISVAQLVALKALYGLPLDTDEELEIFKRATEKQEYEPSERRIGVFVCGRRSGKDDKLAANVGIFEALFREHKLSRGERGYILLLAATREQAKVCFGYIRGKLEASPILSSMIEGEIRADEIDLKNGCTISVQPANFRTIRGRSAVCVVCSEIAFWHDDTTNANPAKEILRALRPSMATFPNAKQILISSPFAKIGVLHDYWSKRHSPDWGKKKLVWRLDSLTMNPTLDRELLREEEANDPENFSREYLANFWDSTSNFLHADAIEACVQRGRFELPPQTGSYYTAALDAAFKSGDAFAFSIVHFVDGKVIQDVTRSWHGSRAKPVDLASTLTEIVATLRGFMVGHIYGDSFCSEPIRQALATQGIRFELTHTLGTRAAGLWNTLRTLVAQKQIELLDDPETIGELKRLQLIATTGGNQRIEAQTGHDDRAVALALAAHEAVSKPAREPQLEVVTTYGSALRPAEPGKPLGQHEFGPERWWTPFLR
jgi:hypothetical protein